MKGAWLHTWEAAWGHRGYKEPWQQVRWSEEQVGADTVEYGRGMAGGTEAGEDVDGKGKGAAEEVGFASEGVGLRGKGSGPKEYWAESSKGGSLKKGGAQRDCGQIGSGVQSSCEESRLIEAIVGAALWTEGGGKTGADEALLEEVSRYSLPENCSLLSFGDRGLLSSSSSFCGEKNEDVMAVRDLVALEGPYVGEGLIKMDVMKLRVLSWNVRGANDSEKRKVIKALIKSQKVDVVCLQETKIQEMSRMIVRSLGVGRCLDWKVLNSRGASGGVLVFWDKRVLHLLEAEVGNFSVSCRFKNCEDGFCWLFSGVYGPSLMKEREDFWAELGAVRGLWSDPWCVAGDFNVVRFPVESSRGGRLSASMRRFSEIMEDLRVVGGAQFSGSASYVLVSKLKALKSLLRDWNKLEFGKVEVNKALALSQVDFWENGVISDSLCSGGGRKRGAKEDFKKWALMEEISWRQKSREVWLREGDRNTKFFHKMANAHRRGNMLSRVKINGVWLETQLKGLSFERLEAVDAASLEEPFSEQEVMEALKGFCGDKAPGPDGFSMAFWQSSWEFVKEEVLGFFREFHNHGRFVKSLNATFIVLIPKKGGAEDLRDFRPISLVGGLYKWLAKVLANRLKRVVGKVVSKAQNAFVRKANSRCCLVANEVLDSVLKNKEEAVMCKLDIEKAYDHVEWSFLFSVMRKMGFGEKWIRWMKWCISTVSFSVLVNGSSSAFSSLLRKAVAGGFVSACKARSRGGEGVNVSHLLFADDTLVFCGASKVAAVWDGVEERMRKKLARWKSQYISKGGRITLIRSTLANMPIYFMSMLSMPRKVRLRLERIQREFLWGGGALERKIHLVNWRFAMEREAFLEALIEKVLEQVRGKYGEEQGGWSSKEARGETHGVGLWKTLRKEWEVVKSRLVFVVGNGKRIKFWKDIWCGDEPLCVSFPSLFALAVSRMLGLRMFGGSNMGKGSHIGNFKGEVRTLWVLLYSMFGVQWVLPATVKETLSGWNGSFVGKKRKGVWKASPLCLFWTVWKTRNKVAFEEKELSIQRLKASFVYFLWSETKRSIKDGPSTLVDFVGWVASVKGVDRVALRSLAGC
ncbi:LINE-1 reverse transcriptase-like [Vitis vinifera]|uniref:LINE-1 reverse transcriptase-like n=1 Tax=Vitis vinifera TaxID=29760 RepID=A0A438D0H7_VITVI|nr:LINE-1 reverse transcriptase-like [Vitis vinifera]